MKRLVVFSGTTEGRALSEQLAKAGARVAVCVASEYGEEQQPTHENIEIHVGPLDQSEKLALLSDAALCVDATHPYATHVTASVRTACEKARTPYLRLLREKSEVAGAVEATSAAEAAAYLSETEGNVLLSTGAKELDAYAALDPERLFPRVLPSHAALDKCEALGIPHRNIIAMQGPFSTELNEAILRQYHIRYLVTKDGGAPGGFPEKAAAARNAGVELIVLRRPEEAGLDYDTVLRLCRKQLFDD